MFDRLGNALGCGAVESPEATADAPPPVMVNKQFISPNEQRLFHTLQRCYGSTGHVVAEVALNRLLWFPNSPDRSRRQRWVNRINGRSTSS